MVRKTTSKPASAARVVDSPFTRSVASSPFGSSIGLFSSISPLSFAQPPPDYSAISDSATVVLFKSLLKQSEVTKRKAVEEILAIAQEHLKDEKPLDDGVVQAWLQSYPRLSVDISRLVRQTSHVVMGTIAKSEGKRIVRHLGSIAGAWLAGLYDQDKGVAKTALDSVILAFGEDKVDKFWQIYQEKILDYCRTVIFHETASTLSDERHVSPDDSASKYSRVISTAIAAISHLLENLDTDVVERHINSYEGIFSNKQLWEYGSDSDPYIRRSIYQLGRVTLTKRRDLIQDNIPFITSHALWKALQIAQGVAALEFLDFLSALLMECPQAWTTTKTGKKKEPPASIFGTFCANGPQAVSADDYWFKVGECIKLLKTMETNQLPTDIKTAQKLINAIKAGTTRKFGTKVVNASAVAWSVLFNTIFSELEILNEEDAGLLIQSYLLPIYLDFIFDETAGKGQAPQEDLVIRSNGLIAAVKSGKKIGELAFNPVWKSMEIRIEKLLLEGEPDNEKARAWVTRWVRLTEGLINVVPVQSSARKLVEDTILTLYIACLRTIGSDAGLEATSLTLLNELLSLKQSTVWQSKDIEQETNNFFIAKLPSLLPGENTTDLLSAVVQLGDRTNQGTTFHTSWKLSIETLVGMPDKEKLSSSILLLFGKSFGGQSLPFPEVLRDYLETKLEEAITNPEAANWEIFQAAVISHGQFVTEGFAGQLLSDLVQNLSNENLAPFITKVIENIARKDAAYLKTYVSKNKTSASELLTRLLSLSHELDEKISASASYISSVLEQKATQTSTTTGEDQDSSMLENMISAIKIAVQDGDKDWLTVESLVERANGLLARQSGDKKTELVTKFLFTKLEWESALAPFWFKEPSASFAISSPLAGATFLVREQAVEDCAIASYDEDGLSGAFRMADFSQTLLEANTVSPSVDSVYYLSLVLSLIKDNLDIAGANDIFKDYHSETTAHSAQLTYKLDALLSGVAIGDEKLIELLLEAADGPGAFNYYNARILAEYLTRSLEKAELETAYVKDLQEKIQLGQEDSFLSFALLHSLLPRIDKEQIATWRERSVRDVTSFNFAKSGSPYRTGISKLVYLNALLPKPEDDSDEKLKISPNALRFLVEHILEWNLSTWIEECILTKDDSCLAAETAKTLTLISPHVKDTRGSHWGDVADLIESFPKTCEEKITTEQVPALYWVLKLLAAFRKVAIDGHGDVSEDWPETEKKITGELFHVLQISKDNSTSDLPRDTTNRLLARELSKINVREIVAPEQLYELVAVHSEPIQDVAFEILHRYIPSVQEDLSIELALTASQEEPLKIEFEPGLISLLEKVPFDGHWENLPIDKGLYLSLKAYLLGWLLVFDHFENATILLKGRYIDLLRELEVGDKLWAFTFDILGFTIGKPLDASKYPITEYSLSSESDPLLDIRHLTVHLYYLSLQHSRVLLNTYLTTIKNRQTTLSVESFTSRYISPILISNALSDVKSWRQTATPTPQIAHDVQGEEIEGGSLTVKISPSAAEVIASYTIDTQTLEASLTLSPTYPLSPPTVTGLKRVGMSEKQYLSIIRATKSTIALHGGSLVDGLSLFEKNLNAHFRGVGECTICYSILSLQDGSLPGKKCGVCKNGFHAGCLFKWFKSTNQSSCPLCRTSWQF